MELLNFAFIGVLCMLALVSFEVNFVGGSCTFPSDIRGAWTRNHDDQAFTFDDSTVNGFAIKYFANDLPDFECHTQSGDKYILVSDFNSATDVPFRYLVCWQLEKVTSSAYILYELTSDVDNNLFNPPDEPGIAQLQSDPVDVGSICELSTDYFTVLIKDGATSDDVAAQCPSSLFADFEYSQCAGSSLAFCTDRTTATADYSSCSAILNSAGGVLSCMGYKEVGSYTYLNMFKHDAGNGVTCMRLESGDDGAVSAKYYTGDCTTAGGSSNDLDLTPTTTCPLGGGGGGGGGGDDSTGGIVGGTVTVAAVAAAAVLGALYFLKLKKKKGKVADNDLTMINVNSSNSMNVELSEAPASTMPEKPMTTSNGTPANGTPSDGTATNGTPANGTPADGSTTNGIIANSVPADSADDPFPSPKRNPHLAPLAPLAPLPNASLPTNPDKQVLPGIQK